MVEGDAFHPPANVAKMQSGTPLTDDDRWPWLHAIGREIEAICSRGESAVIASSALKRAYRDSLIGGRGDVALVYLKGSKELVARRMAARRGHFMPPALLDSQFAALEEPTSLIAWAADGEPLTPDHGWPLRLVVASRYFWKSAKWLRGLELRANDQPGFWERLGYNNEADFWKEERYGF